MTGNPSHAGQKAEEARNLLDQLLQDSKRELEAESLAYLVCSRNGVKPRSHTYLAGYVENNLTIDDIDVYQIMRAAGQVENLLGLTEGRTGFAGSGKG